MHENNHTYCFLCKCRRTGCIFHCCCWLTKAVGSNLTSHDKRWSVQPIVLTFRGLKRLKYPVFHRPKKIGKNLKKRHIFQIYIRYIFSFLIFKHLVTLVFSWDPNVRAYSVLSLIICFGLTVFNNNNHLKGHSSLLPLGSFSSFRLCAICIKWYKPYDILLHCVARLE